MMIDTRASLEFPVSTSTGPPIASERAIMSPNGARRPLSLAAEARSIYHSV